MEYNFNKLNKKLDKVTNLAKKMKRELNDLHAMIESMEDDNVQYNHKEFIVLAEKAKIIDEILKTVK